MNNEIKDVIIIGGGISGLSALHFIKKKNPQKQVMLYEADDRLGGTIGTDDVDGYSFDWGPNGFLDREPLTLQLVDELGISDKLERANDKVTNRFILRGSKLRLVPMSPQKFMISDILPLLGKLRLMTEPFASKRPDGIDETIYEFVKRRIGKDAADYLVQPMVSGIYGGMADRLSLKSCFPIMREMEDEYGSLFKAMIFKAKKAKAESKKSGGPSGPGGWLTSFDGGLFKIIEQFESVYKENIQKGQPVSSVLKENNYYNIELGNGEKDKAYNIIFALPTYQAANIVTNLSQNLSQAFDSIPYAPISVVCFGYDKNNVEHNLDGFGFLVPSKEKRKILGSIWSSSIFANRAPDGKVQFRSMIGGDGDHQSINLSDDELIKIVKDDLSKIVGLKGDPETVKIYRWAQGIPQFKIGHSDRMDTLENELKNLGNLYVTGNAFYGIGLNDCVKLSYKVAQEIK